MTLTHRSTCRGSIYDRLSKVPHKPQQRLFALRVVILPGLYHLLTLGGSTLGRLKKIDVIVRDACRKWLSLPHDAPNAYFRASVRDGGLSIPSIRWLMPMRRVVRLREMMSGSAATERDVPMSSWVRKSSAPLGASWRVG